MNVRFFRHLFTVNLIYRWSLLRNIQRLNINYDVFLIICLFILSRQIFLKEMDIFNAKIQSYIDKLDVKKRTKYTIKNDMYLDILNVLKSQNINVSSKFKFLVRQTFRLVQIGSSDLIYVAKTNLPLITHENLYVKITDCHVAVGHSGRDKTWAEVIIFVCILIYNTLDI